MEIVGQNVQNFGVGDVDMKRSLSAVRMLLVTALATATALMLSVAGVYAIPTTFVGNLAGANEVPLVPSPGTGFATVVLDPTAQTIQINVIFSGLTSNDVAAHIHCCAPLGTNAGVATTVPAFPGFPLGVTSGSYSSAVFNLTESTIYNPAFVTLQGGTIPGAEAALIGGILNGMTYLNIHTVNFQGGEIRGQLFATPEPSTLLLFSSGLAGLLLCRKRTRESVFTFFIF